MQVCLTSSDVIDAIGGTRAFSQWWGCSDALVSAWRTRGFPANSYVAMIERLREQNIEAPPSAWGMVEVA